MTCSKDCLDSTNALVAAEPTLSTCQCAMGNSNCTIEQTRLASCYGKSLEKTPDSLRLFALSMTATPGSCAHASAVCRTDVTCNAALQTYLTECEKLFDSGAAADCTTKCRDSLNNLLTVDPSFINCSCAGDAECIMDQTNLEKGCYGEAIGLLLLIQYVLFYFKRAIVCVRNFTLTAAINRVGIKLMPT